MYDDKRLDSRTNEESDVNPAAIESNIKVFLQSDKPLFLHASEKIQAGEETILGVAAATCEIARSNNDQKSICKLCALIHLS